MIKNYKQFNESLLDKLEGTTAEDIKKNFLKGEIRVDKYINLCDENGWEHPTYEECRTLFLNGKINVDRYSNLCTYNEWIQPTDQEIYNSILKERPGDMLWYSLKLSFLPGIKKAIELGAEPHDGGVFEFLNRNYEIGIKDITMKEYEIVKYLLNMNITPKINYVEYLVNMCFPENKILIDIIKLLLDRLIEVKEINKLDFNEMYEYCEDNKNKELLEILKKSNSAVEYIPSKKKWYEKVFKSNESLLDKLEGPSKEEVWKNLGYEKPFDTPEEYFNEVFEKFKHIRRVLRKEWYDNDDLCIEYDVFSKIVTCYLDKYFKNVNSLFDLTLFEIRPIIGEFLRNKLNLNKNVKISFLTDEGEFDSEYENEFDSEYENEEE